MGGGEGLKHDSCHYLNSTNNPLESINQKVKSVVSKYSSVITFFRELKLGFSVIGKRPSCCLDVSKVCFNFV